MLYFDLTEVGKILSRPRGEIRIDLDPGVGPDFVGSMTDMRTHFFERSFDAIWSSHSLEHLHTHEIPHALAEFRRILRDDGFALISCPDLETVMTLFLEHGSDHVIYHSAAGPITPLDMMFGHTPSIASGNLHMAHHSGLTAERLALAAPSGVIPRLGGQTIALPVVALTLMATEPK